MVNDLKANVQAKDFLTLLDFTPQEVKALLHDAVTLKKGLASNTHIDALKGQSLGMIFENASTRTRVSFEVGMTQLGGHSLFLSPRDMQIGRGEPIEDTAQVLSRYVDAIMIRTNSHELVEQLAHYATVPVINALTDNYHPCQALADLLTIYEKKEKLQGLKLVYVGDGNNMAQSLLVAGAKVGMDVTVTSPEGYEVDEHIFNKAKEAAKETGATLSLVQNPKEAVQNADIIYTDVWASMGFEEEHAERVKAFANYEVNAELVQAAKEDYIFMHCLPAHRGEEVAAEVIDDHEHSVIYDQAENRLHAQKAILLALMK